MSNVVVLGCGELPWGRPYSSPLFGRKWKRGRLRDGIQSTPSGFLAGVAAGHDWIRLADEIDRLDAWLPAAPVGPAAKLVLAGRQAAEAPVLPAWQEFADTQARWVTRELHGAGVLVTPGSWLTSTRGRQVLEAWETEGWSWAALEKALAPRHPAGDLRIVAAAGLWLRSIEEGENLVCANGAAAARAFEVTSQVLDFALGQLDGSLASRWREEEEIETGWFARQQIAAGILAALASGRSSVELGGDSPLFRFASAAASTRYELLASLRIGVEVPPQPVAWWDLVSRPGGLRAAGGVLHAGLRWRDRRTVLLDAPQIRQLAEYLTHAGLPYEQLDPAGLEAALDLGAALPPRPTVVTAPLPAPAPSSAPPQGGSVVPFVRRDDIKGAPVSLAVPASGPDLDSGAAEALPARGAEDSIGERRLGEYQPNRFILEVLHRPDRVQVWVDGRRIEQGDVRRAGGEGLYFIAGAAVPHRAVVRIDFEPAQE